MKPTLQKFLDLLSSIVKRPGMYQVSDVEDLYLFISGYLFAADDEVSEMMHQFRQYVNRHFADEFTSQADLTWDSLIKFNSLGPSGSIQLFDKLFEKFKVSYFSK